ncbi:DUF397 domain-containing protein [Embleya sp. NPDC008237]|uniref:DUF397 domain-containing protein n=1 Tax=Embleya sp. NPDC008237 TaxID=3363978 RepID=UPI0036E8DF9E
MHATPDLSAAAWRKSSHSNDDQGACVEVSDDFPGLVPVRDSKDPSVGHLVVPGASWAALTAALAV